MKTILAPTDFSVSSLNAVNYAADLAYSINAKLVLIHAIPFPIAVSEISVPGDFIDDMMDASQKDMDELFERVQSRTKGKISISTEIKIGSIEQEIENISSRERPLAVVTGIRSGWRQVDLQRRLRVIERRLSLQVRRMRLLQAQLA